MSHVIPMSSGSRKRRLGDDPSIVGNEKVKVRKEDGQPLRETEPFASIDDVTLEFRSIEGYVAPEKSGDFQKILEKLDNSDTLFRKKQGQNVAPDPELRFLHKEDVTELRKLIDEYGAKAGKLKFEELLEKMGSEDRLVVKKMNHRDNSNREEVAVEGDRTRFVSIDPPKEELVDISVHEMEVDDVPQLVEPGPKIEPVEEDEHHIDPDVDEDVEQLEPSTPISVQQLDHEDDDDPQSKPSEPTEDSEQLSDLSDYTSDVDLREKDNEALESNDELEDSDNEGSDGPEEESDDHSNMDSDDDDDDAMKTDNEEQDAMESLDVHDGDDDTQSNPSEPVEDPDELSDLSYGDVVKTKNEVANTPLHQPSEEPEEEANELSGSDNGVIETDNEEQDSVKSEDEDSLEYEEMSPDKIIRRFCHLSDNELFRIIFTKPERRKFAFVVLSNRRLKSFIVEADRKVLLLLPDSSKDLGVDLGQSRDYGSDLVRYIHIALKGYNCSHADFEFKAPDYGSALPFERIFGVGSRMFKIHRLDLNNPELLPLLRYVRPKYLGVSFPSVHLFDNDGTFLATNLKRIFLFNKEVDDVDKLMECHTGSVELPPNASWSDDSIKRVLTAHMNSRCSLSSDRHHDGRIILCHCASHWNVKPHQRTITQWRKLFDDWRRSYRLPDGTHKNWINYRIKLEKYADEMSIAFELDQVFNK